MPPYDHHREAAGRRFAVGHAGAFGAGGGMSPFS